MMIMTVPRGIITLLRCTCQLRVSLEWFTGIGFTQNSPGRNALSREHRTSVDGVGQRGQAWVGSIAMRDC